MAKFLKAGKVVVILNGRFAENGHVTRMDGVHVNTNFFCTFSAFHIHLYIHKSILIASLHFDDGEKSSNKKFGCALVVGIEDCPRKVTRGMSNKKIERRSRMKPFVKLINYNHFMPTRYNFEVDFKGAVTLDTLKDANKKKEAKKEIRAVLGEKYKTGQNKWFFSKLRF